MNQVLHRINVSHSYNAAPVNFPFTVDFYEEFYECLECVLYLFDDLST